jgi:hypothetical protein
MPHKTRPVRPLSPKFTAEEEALYQRALTEGMYQGLLDYPDLKAIDRLTGIVSAACTENEQFRREIFVSSWIGGYKAVLLQMLNAKSEVESTVALVKILPREQALALLQSFQQPSF